MQLGHSMVPPHSSDTVPCLWRYGARVALPSPVGSRQLAVSDLYGEDGRSWLKIQPGEILTRVQLPPPGAPVGHRKLRLRGAIDYGALLVAVQRTPEGARAVLSALGPSPLLVEAGAGEDLAERAWAAAHPLSTHAISTPWRKHMVRIEVRRALAALEASGG